MLTAEVIINHRAQTFNQSLIYRVPEQLVSKMTCGQRVLVPLGSGHAEGFVRNLTDSADHEGLKPVIEILDDEPVLDTCLFELAEWVASYYLSPLSAVLSVMVPVAMNQPKMDVVALADAEGKVYDLLKDDEVAYHFLGILQSQGTISVKQAIEILGQEHFDNLSAQGMIHVAGRYSGQKRLFKDGWVYRLDGVPDDSQLEILSRRAPRQYRILETLATAQEMDCRTLEASHPLASIKSLIQKGMIERVKYQPEIVPAAYSLTSEQESAVKAVCQSLPKGEFAEFLLHGVTGGGKTEVYLSCAAKAIESGKQVIVLVPEIVLTEHLVEQFSTRIPGTSVIHSGKSPLERYQEWKRIRSGEVNLVLGTRSAVFAPLPDLGLIIVDEEQESTYKQEETPRYNAREVARFRCQLARTVLLLGSATPAVETYFRTDQGLSGLLNISKRVEGVPLPKITVEDMKPHLRYSPNTTLSGLLIEKVTEILRSKEQCILFLNRRGYSPMTICRECGMIATCPNCAVGLNYHDDLHSYVCHYCNYQTGHINRCVGCGSQHIASVGFGTQRIEEEVRSIFPSARIRRLDLDISRRRGSVPKILQEMSSGGVDILVGTQMVARGLDFPRVSLVGIINADGMLNLPDYRAGERTFQLLVQAAGRSGRGLTQGEVVIQTYQPDHPVIKRASEQDYHGFYREEIEQRKTLDYPPYTRLLRIEISSENESRACKAAEDLKGAIEERIDSIEEGIQILGPAPCFIPKLRNRYRFQIVVKTSYLKLLHSVGQYLAQQRWDTGVRVIYDMDPGMMM